MEITKSTEPTSPRWTTRWRALEGRIAAALPVLPRQCGSGETKYEHASRPRQPPESSCPKGAQTQTPCSQIRGWALADRLDAGDRAARDLGGFLVTNLCRPPE